MTVAYLDFWVKKEAVFICTGRGHIVEMFGASFLAMNCNLMDIVEVNMSECLLQNEIIIIIISIKTCESV